MPESASTPAETTEAVAAEPVATAGAEASAPVAAAAQHYNDDTTLSEYLESLLVTVLLYRNISSVARMAWVLFAGVLAALTGVIVSGFAHAAATDAAPIVMRT